MTYIIIFDYYMYNILRLFYERTRPKNGFYFFNNNFTSIRLILVVIFYDKRYKKLLIL